MTAVHEAGLLLGLDRVNHNIFPIYIYTCMSHVLATSGWYREHDMSVYLVVASNLRHGSDRLVAVGFQAAIV